MSKRKRIHDIEKMIKEGYGDGIGSEYKPWIKIQDVPSLGRVTRVKGMKTNRQHELLSEDQTSENDYIIISYLYKNYDGLSEYQKEEIKKMVLEYMLSKQKEYEDKNKKEIENVQKNGIKNINKFLGLPSYVVPIDLKYKIFQMIVEFSGTNTFCDNTIEDYIGKIVKLRNTVAHKKLDICRMQKNILYYDNIKQFCNRKCPEDCKDHTNENKISVEEWKEIRRQIISYGNCFDVILGKIMEDINPSEQIAASLMK